MEAAYRNENLIFNLIYLILLILPVLRVDAVNEVSFSRMATEVVLSIPKRAKTAAHQPLQCLKNMEAKKLADGLHCTYSK